MPIISIMTFNIKFGLAKIKGHTWEKRKASIISTIKKVSPDFICFQEVNDFQMEFLKKKLNHYNFTGLYPEPEKSWQDLPVFYKKKYTLVSGEHFFISHTPKIKSILKGSIWPRQFVSAEFVQEKQKFHIINTHFDFKDSVQKESVNIIVKKLKNAQPVFICGDFNADPTGVCHMEFFKKGFKDSFRDIQTPTFHDFTGIPQKGRIDWILYKGDNISVLRKKIIMDPMNKIFPSDHFPVFSEFRLSEI